MAYVPAKDGCSTAGNVKPAYGATDSAGLGNASPYIVWKGNPTVPRKPSSSGSPVTSGAVIVEDEVLGEKKPTTVANPVRVPVPENFPSFAPSAKALANVPPAKESDLNENGWKPNEGEA